VSISPDGRFRKGERRSPATEFKPGEHWREPQPFWSESWLRAEYAEKGRSAGEIAREFGTTDAAILFWLRKHGIPRRSISEARARKHWGASGEDNPMWGKRGPDNPNWRGGGTPERQAFYSSSEWRKATRDVWKRDRATCQRCAAKAPKRSTFHIHHIIPFAVAETRCEVANLVLLCGACHRWVHSRANTGRVFLPLQEGGAQ
jgi:hypothetical protein